jgi:hypothetical protein
MVQSMVEFLNGDTDYAEKKVVFKGQVDYRIGRAEGQTHSGMIGKERALLYTLAVSTGQILHGNRLIWLILRHL